MSEIRIDKTYAAGVEDGTITCIENVLQKIDERILKVMKFQTTENYMETECRLEELIHLKGEIVDRCKRI